MHKFGKDAQCLKRFGVLMLVAILVIILFVCLRPLFLTEDGCKTAKSQLLIAGMGALGTCFTVWLALMATYRRRFLDHPELEMEVSHDLPFCMLLQNSTNERSGQKSNLVEICGKVFNTSEIIATDCQVICRGCYVFSPDLGSAIELKRFRPVAFPWADSPRKPERMDISRSMERFFKFAEISYPPDESRNGEKIDEMRSDESEKKYSSDETATTSQKASFVVFIPGDEELGTKYRIPDKYQSILLQISIACIDDTPKTYGIRLDWRGEDPSDFSKPGLFSVRRMGEAELLKLIGAGK